MKKQLYPLYHDGGVYPCGGIAIYTTHQLIEGVDSLFASNFVRADGSSPVDYEETTEFCASCNLKILVGSYTDMNDLEIQYRSSEPIEVEFPDE